MSEIVIDAACSIDGFWADERGLSIFPVEEMHNSGLVTPVIERVGAVVMSDASFRMADDPDWYADNYEHQRPIFVVTADPPARTPRGNGRISFTFVKDYPTALDRAVEVACDKDVVVIGEASAVQAVLALGRATEIQLRIVPRILGEGIPLFGGTPLPASFRRIAVECSDTVTHLRFVAAR